MLKRLTFGVTRLKPTARLLGTAVQPRNREPRDASSSNDDPELTGRKGFPRSVFAAKRYNVGFYLKLSLAKPVTEETWRQWGAMVEGERFKWEQIYHCPPVWMQIHLLACKVRSPVDAVKGAKLVLRYAHEYDSVARSALLILAARTLARYQASPVMEDIARAFMETPLTTYQERDYNHLLMAMSHFRMTPELGKLVIWILETMYGRQIKLHPRTFRSLLSNNIVTLELAKLLQRRNIEGSTPDSRELEAYLRLFAKSGAVRASARYLNLIRAIRQREKEEAPYGAVLDKGANVDRTGRSKALRWNTEFLLSFSRHSGSAFHYLKNMLSAEQQLEAEPVVKAPRSVRFPFRPKRARTAAWKRGITVSDWTTALQAVARDRSINRQQLLELFSRIRSDTGMQITVAVITVVMRGLVKKGDYDTAYRLWSVWLKVSKRDRIIDKRSLTVAMIVLVGAGHPLEAWDTLISATSILTADGGRSQPSIKIPGRKKRQVPVKADTVMLNSLMSAFLESGRTDMVFKLWEAFTPLFDIYPDSVTITLVLRAAREAARFDHTFRGLLEQMGLHGIFQRNKIWPDYRTKTKKEIAQSLRSMIYRGQPKDQDIQQPEVKRIRKALWNNELAGPKTRELFKRILFSNWPRLMHVQVPAVAIWEDNAQGGHPIRDALRAIGVARVHKSNDDSEELGPSEPPQSQSPLLIGPTLLQPSQPKDREPSKGTHVDRLPKPEHPQIAPDAKAFGAYIELLGGLGRGSEVAQVLAWMRELSVQPSRRTLALALVLWSEVSMRGPLLERYGSGLSEYEKLYRWLVYWLGHSNMPTEGMMGWAFRYWKREREK